MSYQLKRFTASPACCPTWDIDRACALFSEYGLSQIEIFAHWTESRFRETVHSPEYYQGICSRFGLNIVSCHLPPVELGKSETFEAAVRHLDISKQLGSSIVVFGGDTIETYIRYLPPILEKAALLGLQVLIENHKSSCLQTLNDYDAVLNGVNDPRLQTVLEVGHFAAMGIQWRQAYNHLKDRMGLVHLKDMRNGHACQWGEGDIDFVALLDCIEEGGYRGTCVIEFEGPMEERPEGFRRAVKHLQSIGKYVK